MILIIGGTGQLGSQLTKDFISTNKEVLAPSKNELDISNSYQFKDIIDNYDPDIVINTAAFHNTSLCEKQPLEAFKYNCISVKNMAEITNNKHIPFITFSTNYVFDGTKTYPYLEYDKPNPLNIYGISKLAGEYLSLIYNNTIVIRTSGLYGASTKNNNFVDNIIKEATSNDKIEISNEQFINSTYTEDLSKAIIELINHPLTKIPHIYHLTNSGFCSWYELAKETFSIMNIDTTLIPVNREGHYNGIRRPLFSALKNQEAAKLGINLPQWKDGLSRYLKNNKSKI